MSRGVVEIGVRRTPLFNLVDFCVHMPTWYLILLNCQGKLIDSEAIHDPIVNRDVQSHGFTE